MQYDNVNNNVMPPSAVVRFSFEGADIIKLPVFLFLKLGTKTRLMSDSDQQYQILAHWGDKINTGEVPYASDSELLPYLRQLPWADIDPYVFVSPDTRAVLAGLWGGSIYTAYNVELQSNKLPKELFRYTSCRNCLDMLKSSKLYLPSPSSFTDPYDCNIRDEVGAFFRECGVGCFSAKKGSVLMFAHYGEGQRGVCFGVDPIVLAGSMSDGQAKADIRPVWYFEKMPPFDLQKEPALLATCKHTDWSYEKEYRLFRHLGETLSEKGPYAFDVNAIRTIIFGCNTTDDCINSIKSATQGRSGVRYFRARRPPDSFDLELREDEAP